MSKLEAKALFVMGVESLKNEKADIINAKRIKVSLWN
jgi:hypothetical protein